MRGMQREIDKMRRKGSVTLEAEMGVMGPSAKESQPTATRSWEKQEVSFSLEPLEGALALPKPWVQPGKIYFRCLASRTMRE